MQDCSMYKIHAISTRVHFIHNSSLIHVDSETKTWKNNERTVNNECFILDLQNKQFSKEASFYINCIVW